MADVDHAERERSSVTRVVPPVLPRKLAKVPFLELADGRLHGVVSSGSDIGRVYVASLAAGSHLFSCATNNNRPCGGMGDTFICNHLRALVDQAITQYGVTRVGRYLGVDVDGVSTERELLQRISGRRGESPAATVFSRFLHYLSYLELPVSAEPVPELHWFPATAVVG